MEVQLLYSELTQEHPYQNRARVLAIVACGLLLAEYMHSVFYGHIISHVPERHYSNNWTTTVVSSISGTTTTTTLLPPINLVPLRTIW